MSPRPKTETKPRTRKAILNGAKRKSKNFALPDVEEYQTFEQEQQREDTVLKQNLLTKKRPALDSVTYPTKKAKKALPVSPILSTDEATVDEEAQDDGVERFPDSDDENDAEEKAVGDSASDDADENDAGDDADENDADENDAGDDADENDAGDDAGENDAGDDAVERLPKKKADAKVGAFGTVKKKQKQAVCLGCKKTGHLVRECPVVKISAGCFRCGQQGHTLSSCKQTPDKNRSLPFANCFICNEKGHLAGRCPQNPRGVFPKGGNCFRCGSIYHVANNCSEESQSDQNRGRKNVRKFGGRGGRSSRGGQSGRGGQSSRKNEDKKLETSGVYRDDAGGVRID